MSNFGLPYALRLSGQDGSAGTLNVQQGNLYWNGTQLGSGNNPTPPQTDNITFAYGEVLPCLTDLSEFTPASSYNIFASDPSTVFTPNTLYQLTATFYFANPITFAGDDPIDRGLPAIGVLSFRSQLGNADGGLYSTANQWVVDLHAPGGGGNTFVSYQYVFASNTTGGPTGSVIINLSNDGSLNLNIASGDPQLYNAELVPLGTPFPNNNLLTNVV